MTTPEPDQVGLVFGHAGPVRMEENVGECRALERPSGRRSMGLIRQTNVEAITIILAYNSGFPRLPAAAAPAPTAAPLAIALVVSAAAA